MVDSRRREEAGGRLRVWPFGLVAVAAGVGLADFAVRGPAIRPHAVLLSLMLFVIGWGLGRRKLVALGASVVLLGLLALSFRHGPYGIFFVAAAVGLALCHNGFSGVPERARMLRAGLVGLGVALLVGFGAQHHRLEFRPGYVPRSVVLDSWFGLPAASAALLGLEFALPYDRHRDSAPAPVDSMGCLRTTGRRMVA